MWNVETISYILGCVVGTFIGILMVANAIKKSDGPDIIFAITFEPKDQDEDSTETK